MVPLAICLFFDTLRRILGFIRIRESDISMKCIIVTPEKTVLSQSATFVVLPLFDGECGILPNHAPLIARLGAGELRITGTDEKLTQYYVEGGFVEVLGDTVALLTMYALPAKSLNLTEAEAELEESMADTDDSMILAGIRQEKQYNCRARVRVARKMAGESQSR